MSVLDAALVFRTPWLILATTPILGFWILVFWGGKNHENALWFAIGAIGTAIAWSVQGWEPWNMWINRLTQVHDEYSPIQDATRRFFKTPRLMILHGLLIAVGAPLPWVVSGVSDLLGGEPFRHWLYAPQWWVMLIFGIGEAIRGRAIALYVLAGKLKEAWPNLLTNGNAEA